MPDLAGNLYPEDVGSPAISQEFFVYELASTSGVGGAKLAHVPTIATDNVATDNLVQLYCTSNISTTAPPAHASSG